MRKLFVIYITAIAAVFLIPVIITKITIPEQPPKKLVPNSFFSDLPKEIPVFFADKSETVSIDFEEYIRGVLAAEMPASFEGEALKAQAVAARTYAYYKYRGFANNPDSRTAEHPDAVVCTNPAHCNAFYSDAALAQLHGEEWTSKYLGKIAHCAEDTRGRIMVYEDEPILAVFHSASAGGATEASGDVWGSDLPYLSSVKSEGEHEKNGYISTVEVSADEFKEKLSGKFPDIKFSENPSEWQGAVVFTRGGSIGTVEICGKVIKGTEIRAMFGLNSTHFTVETASDKIIFTSEGSGHGVGMSQYGANYMAKQGLGYEEILKSYYDGAVLR